MVYLIWLQSMWTQSPVAIMKISVLRSTPYESTSACSHNIFHFPSWHWEIASWVFYLSLQFLQYSNTSFYSVQMSSAVVVPTIEGFFFCTFGSLLMPPLLTSKIHRVCTAVSGAREILQHSAQHQPGRPADSWAMKAFITALLWCELSTTEAIGMGQKKKKNLQ